MSVSDGLRYVWRTRCQPHLSRCAVTLLRTRAPVLDVAGTVLSASRLDVEEILERDGEFSVVADNGVKMDSLDASFVLGMDPSERYDREKAWLDAAIRPEDLPRVRELVRSRATQLLDAAEVDGAIDIATGYARSVAAHLVEAYFGITGPDLPTLMRWLRSLFWDLFLNLGDDKETHNRAVQHAVQLEHAILDQIQKARLNPDPQTVLGRLVAGPLTDDEVRRSITGLIVGAVDTTNKAFVQAISQLMLRPKALAEAEAAASAGDSTRVGLLLFEALRFDMHNPVILRRSLQTASLASGRHVEARRRVFAVTLAAMFDPRALGCPAEFLPGRVAPNLHFGTGQHRCQGALLNGVILPELATALLARGGIRRSALGRVTYEGPFPDHLDVRLRAHVPRLLTFPPSVDSETARFVLGHHGVAYRELRRSGVGSALTFVRRLAPIPILLDCRSACSPLRRMVGQLDSVGREDLRLVPLEGTLAARVDRDWELFNGQLGRWVAQWVYYYVLQDRELALRLMTEGVPGGQARAQRLLHPIVVFIMRLGLGGLTQAVASDALQNIDATFDEVEQRLSGEDDFLLGNRFSLSDLAFCACAAPALLLEEYGGALPAPSEMPAEMQNEVERLRNRPAGHWVREQYARYYRRLAQ